MSNHRAQPQGGSRRRKWGVAFLLLTFALLVLHVVTFFIPSELSFFWMLLAGGPPVFAALLLSVILLAPPITGRLWDVAPPAFCVVLLVLHLLAFVVFGATGIPFFFPTGATLLLAVPISLVVLLVGIVIRSGLTRHQWTARLVLLGLFCVVFLVLAASYGTTVWWCSDVGVRLRVAQGGGVDALQAWAIEVLETPADQRSVDETGGIPREKWPSFVRAHRPLYVYVRESRRPEEEHVRIIRGGGFHHWGVLVGRPVFRTENDEFQRVFRWRDGVYGYHEIQ